MDTVRYVIGLLVVVMFPPAVAFWFLIHPFANRWRALGTGWAYVVSVVGMFAMIGGLVLIRTPLMGRGMGLSWILVGAGVGLYAGSIGMEILCRKHLTFRILAGVPELSQGEPGILLTQGIYGRMRHPRYAAVLLAAVGWAMIANYAGVYLVTAALFPVMYLLTVIEERELLERFGQEYASYRDRVPRFVPRWGGSKVAGAG